MFVTAEKERRMFIIFFLYFFCLLLSPRYSARIDWARTDHQSSDQAALKSALFNVVSLDQAKKTPTVTVFKSCKLKIIDRKETTAKILDSRLAPFTILKPQYQEIDTFYVLLERVVSDFEATSLGKGRRLSWPLRSSSFIFIICLAGQSKSRVIE